jgi:hypothetical protein
MNDGILIGCVTYGYLTFSVQVSIIPPSPFFKSIFSYRHMAALALLTLALTTSVNGFMIDVKKSLNPRTTTWMMENRRDVLDQTTRLAVVVLSGFGTVGISKISPAFGEAAAIQDSLDVSNFLRTGVDLGGNMGVSSQAGKSRPQTGVVFRDGYDVAQDPRTGAVTAEILTGRKSDPKAVLVSFVSKWKLETGPVFDVETRDATTGDGAFLAVTKSIDGTKLEDLQSSFFLERLFDPTGRFSFYGPPTDIRIRNSKMEGVYRFIEFSFSNLSQSTNAEIPRRGILVATIPEGTDNAVMLVGSANASRWKKGADAEVQRTIQSFRAIAAPPTKLKLRPKNRSNAIDI